MPKRKKVLIFTGAGISAESGLRTFRGEDGLWNERRLEDVATPEAWARDPAMVLDFYNQRRKGVIAAQPNSAHTAITQLEEKYQVTVVTQNIDDLHERAGSSTVIHLHGNILEARSSIDRNHVVKVPPEGIRLTDACPHGSPLRPNVVWFGESIENYELAVCHFETADKILIVGTSLTVFPAAGLLQKARFKAEKVIVSLELENPPFGYQFIRGQATEVVPKLISRWLNES